VEHGGHRLDVQTEEGLQVHRADFVIDASGRSSRFARLVGRRRARYDRLIGVAAYFHAGSPRDPLTEDSSTLVEAVEQGWWYSARLPGEKLIAAYMTDADLLGHRPPLGADGWNALLEAAPHTRQRIRQDSYPASSAPRILGAQTSRLSAVGGVAWLAAGDAAVTHDPLTSHGITAALGWGLYAGAAAADYLGGRHEALNDYASLMDRAFAQYLILHHDRYLGERRWPDSIFWRRRRLRANA
jgi:flavin-dependent dehydrogenase